MSEHPRWEPVDAEPLSLPEVLALLRARCPWAAAHTHASLAPYALEETSELLEAVDRYAAQPSAENRAELEAELGDVLYQVLFHAAVLDAPEAADAPTGETAEPAAMARIEKRLKDKIVRRHRHVFDSTGPWTLEDVERMYEAVKAAERAGAEAPHEAVRASLGSVPRTMPALARAAALLARCERLGVQLSESSAEPQTEEAAIARELLALVRRARAAGVDPEAALRSHIAQAEAATAEERATAEESGSPRR